MIRHLGNPLCIPSHIYLGQEDAGAVQLVAVDGEELHDCCEGFDFCQWVFKWQCQQTCNIKTGQNKANFLLHQQKPFGNKGFSQNWRDDLMAVFATRQDKTYPRSTFRSLSKLLENTGNFNSIFCDCSLWVDCTAFKWEKTLSLHIHV